MEYKRFPGCCFAAAGRVALAAVTIESGFFGESYLGCNQRAAAGSAIAANALTSPDTLFYPHEAAFTDELSV